ncbi:MAG: FAD-dependent oxidoreductase, partial [Cyanobacteria bacterium HKST-UBA06]|nr:FAD-dependent oxidoreductase [Cyanobacteria bacterium HKST-UBA06]
FEASHAIGGMSRTLTLFGQRVDLGPHHFITDYEAVNNLWADVLGKDLLIHQRLTRIAYNNRLFHYPLQPLNAFTNLGLLETLRCLASTALGAATPLPKEATFEDWMVKYFGRRLFSIFFKTYSEKLWGIPCHELDTTFAMQRIKKLSLLDMLREALLKPKQSAYRSLSTTFVYPRHGAGMLYDRLCQAIEAHGGRLYLNTPVTGLLNDEAGRICAVQTGPEKTTHPIDHVISSMPLTMLIKALPDVPDDIAHHAGQLRFRNTTLVYLDVDDANLFEDHWLYVHMPNLKMGRITNFRNWSPALYGEKTSSVLALEYWSSDDDPFWHLDDTTLIELGKRELKASGLIGNANILDGAVYRIHRCYPMYKRGYQEHLVPVQTYLDTLPGLHAIGRYGAFKYNNQDHSILMGLAAAGQVLDNRFEPLWWMDHNQTPDDDAQTSVHTASPGRRPDQVALGQPRHPLYRGQHTP